MSLTEELITIKSEYSQIMELLPQFKNKGLKSLPQIVLPSSIENEVFPQWQYQMEKSIKLRKSKNLLEHGY